MHDAVPSLPKDFGVLEALLPMSGPVDRCFAPARTSANRRKNGACAFRREIASNELMNTQERFEDTVVLGKGGFGIVHRGRCTKTKTVYAIEAIKRMSCAGWKEAYVGRKDGACACRRELLGERVHPRTATCRGHRRPRGRAFRHRPLRALQEDQGVYAFTTITPVSYDG